MEVYTTPYISMRTPPAPLHHRVPLHRAAHTARPAPPPPQLTARDLYDLEPLLAQMRVRGRVALVRDDHPRLDGEDVAAVVPLLAFRRVHVLGRGQDADLAQPERGGDRPVHV